MFSQDATERIYDRKDRVAAFYAVDASTVRIAQNIDLYQSPDLDQANHAGPAREGQSDAVLASGGYAGRQGSVLGQIRRLGCALWCLGSLKL